MASPHSLRLLAVPALLALLAGLVACSSKTPNGHHCPKPRAAFHVTITAKNGPLPANTVVTVKYGGGSEEYQLASPPAQPEFVFCDRVEADAGTGASDAGSDAAGTVDAGSGPVTALSCMLWTNSAATIDVEGSGYPLLEEQLQAEKDDCGIKTVEYTLVLGETDAGS